MLQELIRVMQKNLSLRQNISEDSLPAAGLREACVVIAQHSL